MQRQHSEFANDGINAGLNLEKQKPDFITSFMKNNVDFHMVSLKKTQSNLAILIAVRAHTTATPLNGTMLFLVQNPSKITKLTDEIRERFKTEDKTTVAAVRDLPYLNAVLNEGLKPTNPVLKDLPRIMPKGGDMCACTFLPEGVSLPPFLSELTGLTRIAEFVAERWLPVGIRPSQFDNERLRVSNPFNLGHSNCIRKSLAWAELCIVLTRLFWRFDITEVGERLDWTRLKTLMIIQKEAMLVKIQVRDGIEGMKKAL